MAALLKLQKKSDKLIFHESSECLTSDNMDHTFCGVMFPLSVHHSLPVSSIYMTSISVRGDLGNVSVYVKMSGDLDPDADGWTNIYTGTHQSNFNQLVPLTLKTPLELKPGQRVCLYVHSTLPGDSALVYDNYCGVGPIWTDDFITVHDGLAHVSNKAFGKTSMWGWGSAWRRDRAFVGRIAYGVRWALWRPQTHRSYGGRFRDGGRALFMLQRREESVWSALPDDVIMYVLNFCKWDWFDDKVEDMEKQGNHARQRVRQGRDDEPEDNDDDEEYIDVGVGSATGMQRTVYTRQQRRAIHNAQRLNSIRGHPMFGQILREMGLMGEGEADDGMVLVEGARLVYFTQAELESSGALAQMEDSDDDEDEEEAVMGMGVEEDGEGDDDEYFDADENENLNNSSSGLTQDLTEAEMWDDEDDDDEEDSKPAAMATSATTSSTTTTTTTTTMTTTTTTTTTAASTVLNRQGSVERAANEEAMMEADEH